MSAAISAPGGVTATSTPTRLLRVTAYTTRKSTFTSTDFHSYWSGPHAALAAPWLLRVGFLEYRQVHITPADHAIAASLMPSTDPVYDGYATFLVTDIETLQAAFTDPYYLSTVKPDEDSFLDRSGGKSKLVIGYETAHILDGKLV